MPNALLLSGRLLTNVEVNNITMLHDICAHMYIHHIGITILLSTHLPFFLAGWLTPTHPVGYNTNSSTVALAAPLPTLIL
jgi:hypothetical protein